MKTNFLMFMKRSSFLCSIAFLLLGAVLPSPAATERWTEASAQHWYHQQPWIVGSNYIPAYAINQLEMWQADTFDAVAIDRDSAGPKAWA